VNNRATVFAGRLKACPTISFARTGGKDLTLPPLDQLFYANA
jgi:hypothetical protein